MLGLAKNPYAGGQTIGEVLEVYMQAGSPDRRRNPRPQKAREAEERNMRHLRRHLESIEVLSISANTCDVYEGRRRKEFAGAGRGGPRTVDLEIQTLVNALNYGCRIGMIPTHGLLLKRPRYNHGATTRHARDCMPASGSELHLLARTLAEEPKSEVLAWQLLFAALTGCRTSEIIRLRTDAGHREPGCIEGDWLWITRSKKGVNPFVLLHPDLRACIAAHRRWLAKKHPGSAWWFPSPLVPGAAIESSSLIRAMTRISAALGNGHRTPHGLRAYFVTVRRSQGASDGQAAAEIGDRTVQLISSTYGQIPPSWQGGPQLGWVPTDGNPSFWDAWAPPAAQVAPSEPIPVAEPPDSTIHIPPPPSEWECGVL